VVWQSFYYNSATDPAELRLPELLDRRGVIRAVILSGTNSPNLFQCLRQRALPFAVFGNNVIGTWNEKDEDVVFSDDVSGACEMVRYLIAQGHHRIWFVGDLTRPWILRAGEGYRRAMQEAGLAPHLHGVSSSEERQVGYLSTKQLLAAGEPVSAILAGSDSTAEGVYRAIRDCGLRVPEDISVAGNDDTEGSILHPPLTTVHWFNEEVGLHLAELLLSRVANLDLPPRQITIPTQLVKRQSCSGPTREPAVAEA
jgi:LacI family transcriptional regulator